MRAMQIVRPFAAAIVLTASAGAGSQPQSTVGVAPRVAAAAPARPSAPTAIPPSVLVVNTLLLGNEYSIFRSGFDY